MLSSLEVSDSVFGIWAKIIVVIQVFYFHSQVQMISKVLQKANKQTKKQNKMKQKPPQPKKKKVGGGVPEVEVLCLKHLNFKIHIS